MFLSSFFFFFSLFLSFSLEFLLKFFLLLIKVFILLWHLRLGLGELHDGLFEVLVFFFPLPYFFFLFNSHFFYLFLFCHLYFFQPYLLLLSFHSLVMVTNLTLIVWARLQGLENVTSLSWVFPLHGLRYLLGFITWPRHLISRFIIQVIQHVSRSTSNNFPFIFVNNTNTCRINLCSTWV